MNKEEQAKQWKESKKQAAALAENNNVVFISNDGFKYELYLDGKRVYGTRGIRITAGADEEIIVTMSLVPGAAEIAPLFQDVKEGKDGAE